MENMNSKKTNLKLSADIFLKDTSCISYSRRPYHSIKDILFVLIPFRIFSSLRVYNWIYHEPYKKLNGSLPLNSLHRRQ